MKIKFAQRRSIEQVEESAVLAPKFDAQGLIPVITTDVESGEVLMQGYMNAEALCQTIATGEAHYYSRSRRVLWHKGATSGLVQQVAQLLIDDDQDCLWMRVRMAGAGASCHVGYRSCFYREIPLGDTVGATELAAGDPADAGAIALRFTESAKIFDPQIVYGGDAVNP
ncbi:MAG: phosphoribosyl-AMP cyclohydrolase, partial [Synechococcales cyanobacterium CRU_2_2]|nr:phosphoribosyl-AMP cyclohydrolase [Synechococcales cyanobacterium CRU_2_2]